MTVISLTNNVQYVSDGVTVVYAYDFLVLDETHMLVFDVDSVTGESVQLDPGLYTVQGVDDPDGGTVTLAIPIRNGNFVILSRVVPISQTLDYVPYDEFPAESHEEALDKLTMICQQLEATFDQVVVYPPGVEPPVIAFPPADQRGGYNVEFSEDGTHLVARYNTAQEWAENPVNLPITGYPDGRSALHYADKSRQWAENDEDVPVETSPDQYSAYHWAQKAAGVDAALALQWHNEWVPGEYDVNSMVTDGNWLMVSNKLTTQRPAPQPEGSPEWTQPDLPIYAELSDLSVVYSGSRITFAVTGWVQSLRCWVPELTADTNYRFILADVTDPAVPLVEILEEPVLQENQWTTLALGSRIVTAGTVWLIYVDALNSGSDSFVTGGWRSGGASNTFPSPQEWVRRNDGTTISFDKTDLDNTDRTAELMGVTPGSTIRILNTAIPANFREYVTSGAPVDQGTYVEYTVVLANSTSDLDLGTVCTVNITIPIAQPTKYSADVDFWPTNQPTWASISGYLAFNGVDQNTPDAAYGIDIQFQPASIASDWDLAAYSGGSGGGSGGGVEGQPLGAVVDVKILSNNYTVLDDDNGKVLRINSGVPVTVTLDTGVLEAKDVFHIVQQGAGQITLQGTGMTFVAYEITPVTAGQYAMLTVTLMTETEALVQGNGVAA